MPASQESVRLIASVGAAVQLSGTLLLVLLFGLLASQIRRKPYFQLWAIGWGALAVALIAPNAYYQWLPPPGAPDPDRPLEVAILNALYQGFKYLFLLLLVAGVRRHAVGGRSRGLILWGGLTAAIVAALQGWALTSLNAIVRWQAPAALLAYGYTALVLLQLPPSRRDAGTRVLAGACVANLALWIGYWFAFDGPFDPEASRSLLALARHNSYFDLLAAVMLGYGMLMVVMSDIKRDVEDAYAQLALAHDQLRHAAYADALTGAFNRRAFEDGVGLDAARASYGTVVMLDVDNLKPVNDRLGHAAGDALLQQLVSIIRRVVRARDLVFRWGGDEFLLVLPAAREAEAGRRVEWALKAAPPIQVAGQDVRLEVNVGTARYSGGEDLDNAIGRADGAMYKKKMEGKEGLEVRG